MNKSSAIRWTIAAILGICAAAVTADDQLDWQNHVASEMKQLWQMTSGPMPILDEKNPPRTIDQVVALSLENGNLVLRTALPSTPAQAPGAFPKSGGCFRVKIGSWPEWATLYISGSAPKGKERDIPQMLSLGLAAFPANHMMRIEVYKRPGTLALNMIRQSPQGLFSVYLSQQDKDDDYTHPHACTLDILIPHPGKPEANIRFAGANFAAMLRDHPDQMRNYLRPLFNEVNGDCLLPIDPSVAWQVFDDAWRPNPKVAAVVNKVLPQLAGGTFRQRSEARKSLEALGTPGALEIIHLDRAKLTPEQNAQLDRVVAPYRQLSDAQVKELRTDVQFLVDCLYCSDAAIRKAAIDQLRNITRLDLSYDPAGEESARNPAIAAIREKLVAGKFLSAIP